jgi:hypothetical protein
MTPPRRRRGEPAGECWCWSTSGDDQVVLVDSAVAAVALKSTIFHNEDTTLGPAIFFLGEEKEKKENF